MTDWLTPSLSKRNLPRDIRTPAPDVPKSLTRDAFFGGADGGKRQRKDQKMPVVCRDRQSP
jgi:hypothetical protein